MQTSYVYITTNLNKSVLYTGITNDIKRRLYEHETDSKTVKSTFAGKFNCYNLIYFEEFLDINQAIYREKEIKGWTRKKKIVLINSINKDWNFLNI
ncbi:MAG: GIY-YIG nuclease family protein [Bacteroidia bacterium]